MSEHKSYPKSDRHFDLILYGATGFTGKLVAEYLLEAYGADGDLRWALAARNEEKLESVRASLQGSRPDKPLPLLAADSADPESLQKLAAQSKVICSTVGPYAQYGSELVAACARQGTDYCDLTGEVQWIAQMIEEHQAHAESSGARIVHSCGFDSIPSDLGNWFVQQAMQEQHNCSATRVRGRVGKTSGGVSGGTVASLIGVMEESSRDKTLRKKLKDKYLLYPQGEPAGPPVRDQQRPVYDPCFARWTTPFVMALINERVVRRSNALLDFPWSRDFDYDESQLCGSRAEAMAISMGLGATLLGATTRPGRALLGKLLPDPGEGPDRATRERGFFELFFHAEHPDDPAKSVRARVGGDRDPGYGATSRMLGEAAVSLAQDEPAVKGGIWTPASALAEQLIPRLERNAGMSFEVLDNE